MSISYCTSNNDRPEIDETTSNERMEDLSDEQRFINAALPLIHKHAGHDEGKDALKLKST